MPNLPRAQAVVEGCTHTCDWPHSKIEPRIFRSGACAPCLTAFAEQVRQEEADCKCQRAHIPDCSWCGVPQNELGALFFGAPDQFGKCPKHHVCRQCSEKYGLNATTLRTEAGETKGVKDV